MANRYNLFLKVISLLLSDIKIFFLLENYDSDGWYVFKKSPFAWEMLLQYINGQLCISILPLTPQVVLTCTGL